MNLKTSLLSLIPLSLFLLLSLSACDNQKAEDRTAEVEKRKSELYLDSLENAESMASPSDGDADQASETKSDGKPDPAESARFFSKEYPISVLPPPGFKAKKGLSAAQYIVEFFSDLDLSGDLFAENIKVKAARRSFDNLNEFFSANANGMVQSENMTVIDSTSLITEEGLPYRRIHIKFPIMGMESEGVQFYYHIEGQGYLMTCTSIVKDFDRYEAKFDAFGSSFRKEE